jgi:hypothetical protein
MEELRADRWLHLVGDPAFLRPIAPREHAWWRPIASLALMLPVGVALAIAGYIVIGLINTWLIQFLMLGETPRWPPNLLAAMAQSDVNCADCLMGGITKTVMVAVTSLACTIAVLTAARLFNHRPARGWITAAPRFRWRLFWAGLLLFGLVLGAAA